MRRGTKRHPADPPAETVGAHKGRTVRFGIRSHVGTAIVPCRVRPLWPPRVRRACGARERPTRSAARCARCRGGRSVILPIRPPRPWAPIKGAPYVPEFTAVWVRRLCHVGCGPCGRPGCDVRAGRRRLSSDIACSVRAGQSRLHQDTVVSGWGVLPDTRTHREHPRGEGNMQNAYMGRRWRAHYANTPVQARRPLNSTVGGESPAGSRARL